MTPYFIISVALLSLTAVFWYLKERQTQQLKIDESETRFRIMADTAPVMIWVSQEDGRYSFCNRSWVAFSGKKGDEALRDVWEKRIHPQDLSGCLAVYFKACEQCQNFTLEYRFKRADGVYRWVEDTAAVRLGPDGHFGGFIGSCVDMTQRKLAEDFLKRDNEKMAQLVEERSRELVKTQKELKQYSRLADIGTLAATVAHELRNPLGVIHLAAYNLKREKGDMATNKHLMNIEKKVWEGNQIIDNLLSYARIKIPNYESVNILQVIDECVSSAQERFGPKGVVIEKEFGNDPDLIEADANQIRDVFLNVLNNACQAINQPSGKVKVRVSHDGDMVKVAFEDTGEGIAAQDLDRVFEPFFTRKSKGTGLGLAICNELVHLHQGTIEIISQLGQGTTVTVLLPSQRRKAGS
jgi:PAS domain S-box-containing protein